ncbi:hypothetical protein PT974_02463 [Cladobotryum mycophilum]|uniref:Uncharacterized protein n=1 Tax=Cladobotryum mycophilum TaxID=491253 RepID=A0ABR0SZF1_9HYPO
MPSSQAKTPSKKRRQSAGAQSSPAKAMKANATQSPAASVQTPQTSTPRETAYTHALPTQSQKKGNGRVVGRSLIMWNRPRMAEKVLLHLYYECTRHKVQIPWDAIAHRLRPGSSGAAIIQHINRLRRDLIAEGHLVPPIAQKTNSAAALDPKIRGYVRRDMDGDDRETTRAVMFDEKMDDPKLNLPDAYLAHDDSQQDQPEFNLIDLLSEGADEAEDEDVGVVPDTPTPARRLPRAAFPAPTPVPGYAPIPAPVSAPVSALVSVPENGMKAPQSTMKAMPQEISSQPLFPDDSTNCDGQANQSFTREHIQFTQPVHATQSIQFPRVPQLPQSPQALPISESLVHSYTTPLKNATGIYDDSSPDYLNCENTPPSVMTPFQTPTRQPIPTAPPASKIKAEKQQQQQRGNHYDRIMYQAPPHHGYASPQWMHVPMGHSASVASMPMMHYPVPNMHDLNALQAMNPDVDFGNPGVLTAFCDFVNVAHASNIPPPAQRAFNFPTLQLAHLSSSSSGSPLSDHASMDSMQTASGESFDPGMPEGIHHSL